MFELRRAVAVATGPWFRTVFMATISAGMCVFYRQEIEKFFPIRAFLFQRRIAKTGFDPFGCAIGIEPGRLHVGLVFVARD